MEPDLDTLKIPEKEADIKLMSRLLISYLLLSFTSRGPMLFYLDADSLFKNILMSS